MNAWATAQKDLEVFIQSTQSWKADFSQTTQRVQRSDRPSDKGSVASNRTLKGSFELQRPGQFRFHYQQPFEQVIVSDGQTLSIHDVDLNQVTQRKMAVAAIFAPALLVASAKDAGSLKRLYDISDLPDAGGLRWLQALPKSPRNGELGEAGDAAPNAGLGGPFGRIELGFTGSATAPQLQQLVIVDLQGQRTTLSFSNPVPNAKFAAGHFKFKAPAGASVIGQ